MMWALESCALGPVSRLDTRKIAAPSFLLEIEVPVLCYLRMLATGTKRMLSISMGSKSVTTTTTATESIKTTTKSTTSASGFGRNS